MIVMTKEQVLMLHEQLIQATGGSTGIRDEGMLDSALSNPFQSFGGEELHPEKLGQRIFCNGLLNTRNSEEEGIPQVIL